MFALASTTLQSTFSLSSSLPPSRVLLLLLCCLQSDTVFVCLAWRHCFPLRWLTGTEEARCWRGLIISEVTKERSEENIESSSPAALYRILGSKNIQGFLSAMQERSSPFACTGPRGTTIWTGQHTPYQISKCGQPTLPFKSLESLAYFGIELRSKHCCGILILNALKPLWVHGNPSRCAWQVREQFGDEWKPFLISNYKWLREKQEISQWR